VRWPGLLARCGCGESRAEAGIVFFLGVAVLLDQSGKCEAGCVEIAALIRRSRLSVTAERCHRCVRKITRWLWAHHHSCGGARSAAIKEAGPRAAPENAARAVVGEESQDAAA
jgi:hypothetical protein